MAWVDDRIWCHPKFTDLTDRAAWVWVKGCAYSAGHVTRGFLSPGQQRIVGADTRVRRELVEAGLWEEQDGGVLIHDWTEHNGKRDERRAKDRERKRAARSAGASAGLSAGRSNGASAGPARVEGSEGSEGTTSAVNAGPNGSAARANSTGEEQVRTLVARSLEAAS